MTANGTPVNFMIFCNRKDVKKSQRLPPFNFLGIVMILTFCNRMDVKKSERARQFQLLGFSGTLEENT